MAAALEASAMPVPQLRAHVAALGRRVEEERAINPYVAVAEESLQAALQPDTLAQVCSTNRAQAAVCRNCEVSMMIINRSSNVCIPADMDYPQRSWIVR